MRSRCKLRGKLKMNERRSSVAPLSLHLRVRADNSHCRADNRTSAIQITRLRQGACSRRAGGLSRAGWTREQIKPAGGRAKQARELGGVAGEDAEQGNHTEGRLSEVKVATRR